MSLLFIILLALFAVGAAIGLYALLAPRKPSAEPVEAPQRSVAPLSVSTAWTAEAGEEFGNLSESARCDLVFAVADLNDERSRGLLVHALDDPSDTVALAAGHALLRSGRADEVKAYVSRHPGPRGEQLMETLALLG
jgi:HEAT repeat protein